MRRTLSIVRDRLTNLFVYHSLLIYSGIFASASATAGSVTRKRTTAPIAIGTTEQAVLPLKL